MDQAIIEKIKKLLALATSSNEHEARLAAEKANELLIRHNLKMQDLADTESVYDKSVAFEAARLKAHSRYVFSILQKHFFVVAVRSRRYDTRWLSPGRTVVYLVGEETNLQVAQYVYGFLDYQFPALWRQFSQTSPRSRQRNYYAGLHAGLNEQLAVRRRAVESDTGLVVVNDPNLRPAVKRLMGKTTGGGESKTKGRASRAFSAGLHDGRALQIRRGITERGDGPIRQIEGKV